MKLKLKIQEVNVVKKSDMISALANETGLTKADVEKVFNGTFELFKNELKKGEKVSVAGFGTFKVSKRAARTGRNPQTGETIKIAASNSVSFKAGSALKEELN
ncbi:MAG: HU family DNA-binding protein [Clostridia bacterium]|nr:HU family DNA-binding protein [Clostridia bacterium]MBO5530549.1 HU family DNA-binding protein [Bacilli bacterium]